MHLFAAQFANSLRIAGDFEICGEAENGLDAINKAGLFQPDVIVIDLAMPVMNGLQATQILRKLTPTVPIIVYSSHSDPFVIRTALSAGAAAFVAKNNSATQLVAKARELLLPPPENLPQIA
jgi:DNA-binding NarL/FixJ family response regulator